MLVMGILQFIKLWRDRKNKFKEEYGVDFPETEKQQCEIANQVAGQLIEAGKEEKEAYEELEKAKTSCSPVKHPEAWLFIIYFATEMYGERKENYELLSRLAHWAGFSRKFFDDVEEKIKEIGTIT
jgi:hypothetical protein